MDTVILDDSAEASDPGVADDTPSASEATPAPTVAEGHVHEVADVQEATPSKLAALRIVYGQRPPT